MASFLAAFSFSLCSTKPLLVFNALVASNRSFFVEASNLILSALSLKSLNPEPVNALLFLDSIIVLFIFSLKALCSTVKPSKIRFLSSNSLLTCFSANKTSLTLSL